MCYPLLFFLTSNTYDFKRKHGIVEVLVLNDETYLKAARFEYSSYLAHKDAWIGNI